VVAKGEGHHPFVALLLGQLRHCVIGSSEFEGPDLLEVLTLEVDLAAEHLVNGS